MNTAIEMDATVSAPSVDSLGEGDSGYLDEILSRLCSLTDEEAVTEGKAKGSSSFS